MPDFIYLDHAAATPVDERVAAAMSPYFMEKFFNPSATYLAAKAIFKDVEEARANVARCFGCRPAEVYFTAGGTEANNMAIHGIMSQYPEANFVVSAIEHESVLAPAETYIYKLAEVSPNGLIDINKLAKIVDENTVLVSIMYANNEIGTIQPLKDVAELIGQIRRHRKQQGNKMPIYLHTDAAQAANYLDIHTSRLGVDMMTLNGGKIYGPKQSGALFVKAGLKLKPLTQGGGQEAGLRNGTENVAGIIGFAKALQIAQNKRNHETARLQKMQQLFLDLIKQKLPNAIVNGSVKKRLPNNLHVTFPGKDNERLLMQLDERGILAAAGSACSASSEEPSHVLGAIGLTDDVARSSLRFTMGRLTDEDMIRKTVLILEELVR